MRILFFVFILAISFSVSAQSLDEKSDTIIINTDNWEMIDYLEQNNVGYLWNGNLSQNHRIGFIGEDFQRIKIHFNSIIQNYNNPFEYFVYGKTMVNENICEFQGSILIKSAGMDEGEKETDIKTGFIQGDYLFYEDISCLHSGFLQGEFVTDVYYDESGTMYYNDLNEKEHFYSNNSFIGEWFHYHSDLTKNCNWGDRRIPYSEGLDVGLDVFKPAYKYLQAGWSEYLEEQKSEAFETEMWWK